MSRVEGLTVRPATQEDQTLVRSMIREARLDPTQLHWSHFVVAEVAGQIVGIGQLRPFGRVEELGSLAVRPEWQGKSIGAALVQALIARRQGPLYLECVGSRATYYEMFAFRRVPWYKVPWPLKGKFALTSLLASLSSDDLVTMYYEGI